MRPDLAPKHVAQIKKLAREGKYDGLVFHRVIDGFMAQTGDPQGTGRGGMGDMLPAEFSKEPFVRGTVGMARTTDPNSAQQPVLHRASRTANFLDGQYTVWGKVVSGMEFVDKIKKGEPPVTHPGQDDQGPRRGGRQGVTMDKENTLYIDLKDGRVVIELRPDLAPKHVAQIKKLAREGKYDGVVFHRVIDGFMAQTGDPDGTGMGGMGEHLPAEFSKEPHGRGVVSMARTSDPEQRAQPVLHLLQGRELPRRPVHRVGQGHVGHGVRRQDQEGRAALEPRQDDQGPGRRRREGLARRVAAHGARETLTIGADRGEAAGDLRGSGSSRPIGDTAKISVTSAEPMHQPSVRATARMPPAAPERLGGPAGSRTVALFGVWKKPKPTPHSAMRHTTFQSAGWSGRAASRPRPERHDGEADAAQDRRGIVGAEASGDRRGEDDHQRPGVTRRRRP